jgi:hypothetical protein
MKKPTTTKTNAKPTSATKITPNKKPKSNIESYKSELEENLIDGIFQDYFEYNKFIYEKGADKNRLLLNLSKLVFAIDKVIEVFDEIGEDDLVFLGLPDLSGEPWLESVLKTKISKYKLEKEKKCLNNIKLRAINAHSNLKPKTGRPEILSRKLLIWSMAYVWKEFKGKSLKIYYDAYSCKYKGEFIVWLTKQLKNYDIPKIENITLGKAIQRYLSKPIPLPSKVFSPQFISAKDKKDRQL